MVMEMRLTPKQVQLLLATAATDSSTSAATPDMDENSVEKSQTILLKISTLLDDARIENMSHCRIEGPARSVGVHREKDGEDLRISIFGAHRPLTVLGSSTLFYINSQGHFLLRPIRFPISPSISSTSDTPPVTESESITSLTLPLAKSFKSMVSRSADTLSLNQSTAPTPPPLSSQVMLNEAVDVGILISDSTITGLSARSGEGKLYGIVWAHHEMTVGCSPFGSNVSLSLTIWL